MWDSLGTSSPQIIGVRSTLHRLLWHALGEVTSTEDRGKNNELKDGVYQGLIFWAPNMLGAAESTEGLRKKQLSVDTRIGNGAVR